MRKFRTGVSFPEPIANEIDEYAAKWFIDRSAAITKIYIEWKELKLLFAKQQPLPLVVDPDESTENPTDQMNSHGCGRLVEA